MPKSTSSPTHAGFDASGNVTDSAQAHQTLATGRQSMGEAHGPLLQARKDVAAALKTARAANQRTRAQDALTKQQTRLDGTNQIVAKTQTLITTLKAQGKDTAALTTAMTAFQYQRLRRTL